MTPLTKLSSNIRRAAPEPLSSVQQPFGPNGSPTGQLAFDSAGNLFVSTTTGNPGSDSILEFTPGGVESTFATGLTSPRGLAFDSTGNLFVTENIPGQLGDILEFTPGGIETVFASGLSNPQFLTFGPARGPAGPNLPDSGSTFGFLSVALATLICLYQSNRSHS